MASISTLVGATFESKTFDSQIEYSYTPNGQIETIEQSGPNAATKFVKYTYNLSGLTTQIERTEQPPPSGNPPTNTSPVPVATTKIGYRDSQGKKTNRVQSMSHTASNSTLGSGTSLASYSLGWDLGGRLVSMTSTADDAATFTYDRTDQLKSATYQKPAYADLTFSYDANGNRTGGGNTPGPDNRQASDGVSDFTYDLDGNMTRRTNKTTGAVVEYAWDLRNRLTDVTFKSSATGPATKKVHYTYDALNRRIGKSVDTDGNGTLDQVDWYANRGLRTDRENAGDEVMLRLGASGNVTGRYLHGASVDEILAEENIASDGKREVLWPLADQQGSVRDIVRLGTNGQATVVDHIMYGPYGEKVAETDTAIAHLYGYTGREYDKETGLQYNRARYYDPKLGRWISQDPMSFDAGDANLYRMTGNHATYASDPSGLDWEPDTIRRYINMGDKNFGAKFNHHVTLTKNSGDTPQYFIDPTHHRTIDISFPASWSEEQVLNAIYSTEKVFSHTFGKLSLVNEVAHRDAYWGSWNPGGKGQDTDTWFAPERYKAQQIAALKEGMERSRQILTNTVRSLPGGEVGYGLYQAADGKLFNYINGEFREFTNTLGNLPGAIYDNPGNASAAAAAVFVFGADGKLIKRIDDAPSRVTKAGEEIRSITVTGWSKGKEAGHFADHAADMGITSQKAYTDAAKALAKKTTDVIEAKVGNTLFKYDKTTQNILIINGGNRKIKTFYKADNGLQSFKEAMHAHWEVLKNQGHKP